MAGTPVVCELCLINDQLSYTGSTITSEAELRAMKLSDFCSLVDSSTASIRATDWAAVLEFFRENVDPETRGFVESIAMLTAFSIGDFTIWDNSLRWCGDMMAVYPGNTLMGTIIDTEAANPTVPEFAQWDDSGLEDLTSEAFEDGLRFTSPTVYFEDDASAETGNWSYFSDFPGGEGSGNFGWNEAFQTLRDGATQFVKNLVGAHAAAGGHTAAVNAFGTLEKGKQLVDYVSDITGTFARVFKAFDSGNVERIDRAFGQIEDRTQDFAADQIPFIGRLFKSDISWSTSRSDMVMEMHTGTKVKFGDHRDTFVGNSSDNKVKLGANDDVAAGFGGRDHLDGQGGHDMIWGGGSSDHLFGRGGTDKLFGGAGNDRVYGGAGKDTVGGGTGNDRLFGGTGNDVIRGGEGNDRLNGGGDVDRFVFKTDWDVDRIVDFDAKGKVHDRLDLRDLESVKSWQDLKNNHLEKDGSDVVINGRNGDRIILEDVTLSSLDKGDFIF